MRGRTELGHAPPHRVVRRRQRDDHLAHAVAPDPHVELRDRPEHADAAHDAAVLLLVVVEQAHDAPLPAARHLVREPRARLARTDDQHRLAERSERAVQAMFLPQAERETRSGHQEDQHDRVEEQHAARYDRLQLQHDEDERDQDRAQARREHDALQVGEAREAPQAAVKPEREEDSRLQRKNPREREQHVGQERLAQVEIEAQPVDPGPGDGRHAGVVEERERRAPVQVEGHREGWAGMLVFLRQ